MQEAGAHALEPNVYFIAADPDETADEVEQRYVGLVEAVRTEVTTARRRCRCGGSLSCATACTRRSRSPRTSTRGGTR
jgi:hypothetical protein